MRTSCFLGLQPPSSKQASLVPIKPPQLSWVKNEDCWRKQFVVMGVASYCTIIGLEICNSVASSGHESMAQEEIMIGEVEQVLNNSSSVSVGGGRGGAKWSQKRSCPPWRGSSLETVVPENLPRPAARRRYEAVRSNVKTAPPLSEAFKIKSNSHSCFSM